MARKRLSPRPVPAHHAPMIGLRPLLLAMALPLAACQDRADIGNVPGDDSDTQPFSRIGAEETVRLTGTEPFWGGEVTGSTLTYSTPENIEGTAIPVSRFAGRGGVSFSGELQGESLDLSVSEGDCSDGMSDRTYPFRATLRIGEDIRSGCAWTGSEPFTGPENP